MDLRKLACRVVLAVLAGAPAFAAQPEDDSRATPVLKNAPAPGVNDIETYRARYKYETDRLTAEYDAKASRFRKADGTVDTANPEWQKVNTEYQQKAAALRNEFVSEHPSATSMAEVRKTPSGSRLSNTGSPYTSAYSDGDWTAASDADAANVAEQLKNKGHKVTYNEEMGMWLDETADTKIWGPETSERAAARTANPEGYTRSGSLDHEGIKSENAQYDPEGYVEDLNKKYEAAKAKGDTRTMNKVAAKMQEATGKPYDPVTQGMRVDANPFEAGEQNLGESPEVRKAKAEARAQTLDKVVEDARTTAKQQSESNTRMRDDLAAKEEALGNKQSADEYRGANKKIERTTPKPEKPSGEPGKTSGPPGESAGPPEGAGETAATPPETVKPSEPAAQGGKGPAVVEPGTKPPAAPEGVKTPGAPPETVETPPAAPESVGETPAGAKPGKTTTAPPEPVKTTGAAPEPGKTSAVTPEGVETPPAVAEPLEKAPTAPKPGETAAAPPEPVKTPTATTEPVPASGEGAKAPASTPEGGAVEGAGGAPKGAAPETWKSPITGQKLPVGTSGSKWVDKTAKALNNPKVQGGLQVAGSYFVAKDGYQTITNINAAAAKGDLKKVNEEGSKGIGRLGGAWIGAEVGGKLGIGLGTFLGDGPGAAVGGFIGALGGGIIGAIAGEKVGEKVGPGAIDAARNKGVDLATGNLPAAAPGSKEWMIGKGIAPDKAQEFQDRLAKVDAGGLTGGGNKAIWKDIKTEIDRIKAGGAGGATSGGGGGASWEPGTGGGGGGGGIGATKPGQDIEPTVGTAPGAGTTDGKQPTATAGKPTVAGTGGTPPATGGEANGQGGGQEGKGPGPETGVAGGGEGGPGVTGAGGRGVGGQAPGVEAGTAGGGPQGTGGQGQPPTTTPTSGTAPTPETPPIVPPEQVVPPADLTPPPGGQIIDKGWVKDSKGSTHVIETVDANGNVTKVTYPGNKTVSYTYDAVNRLKTVSIDWLAKTAAYVYDDAGRM